MTGQSVLDFQEDVKAGRVEIVEKEVVKTLPKCGAPWKDKDSGFRLATCNLDKGHGGSHVETRRGSRYEVTIIWREVDER